MEPFGYGHAVYCGKNFVRDEAFLLVVSDHLYISRTQKSCAQQLIEIAAGQPCSISAVQPSPESKLPYFGVVGGRLEGGTPGLYAVDDIVEKPTPTEAEQRLMVPGLRAGHYLCFFGMHVLTANVMEILAESIYGASERNPVALTPALAELAKREKFLAKEMDGRRYDLGQKYGLFLAQLALAIEGRDRSEVLAQMLELMMQRSG
jgi:UTP--glucose-1-phosphate uridylyltransferase